jgi:DNA-binding transcriptional ArsR family regulator
MSTTVRSNDKERAERIAAVFTALANPRRLLLFHFLAKNGGPISFQDLCERAVVPASSCSRILRRFYDAGLIAIDHQSDRSMWIRAIPDQILIMARYFVGAHKTAHEAEEKRAIRMAPGHAKSN